MPDSDSSAFCAIVARQGSGSDPSSLNQLVQLLTKQLAPLATKVQTPGFALLTLPATPVALSDDKSIALVGDVFSRGSASPRHLIAPMSADKASHAAKTAAGSLWGRYAMFCATIDGDRSGWMRDPSGSQCLYVWHLGSHIILTDRITPPLMECLGHRPRIDWHRLSQLIAQTEMASAYSALEHVDIATPGRLEMCSNDGVVSHTIWSPASFANEARQTDVSAVGTTAKQCIEHWLGDHQRVTVELSGGLDSSIVAGLISTAANSTSIQGLNIIPQSPGGDESKYARSVSEKWGFGLIEASVHPSELDYLKLLGTQPSVEPAVYGLDVVADNISSDLADAFSATRIFSGQGGDAVFFQPHTPLIAADFLAAKRSPFRFAALVRSCAMATNSSVWSVGKHALWPNPTIDRRALPPGLGGPVAQVAWEDVALVHPWAQDSYGLTAGKQMQVAMLANCQLFNRATKTSRNRRLIHPLLSQPLVELCLGIPLWELVPDRRERGLVRDCFRNMLPEPVLNRRGKGEASGFYNRAIVTHLSTLRPFLLDGVLESKGLITRDVLSTLLDVQHLLWKDDHPTIGALVALEIWARQWS